MNTKIAIIGCGKLGYIVADAVGRGLLPGYELCGAMSRKKEDAENMTEKHGGRAAEDIRELLSLGPELVIETASVQMVRECCIPSLEAGVSFVPLSIGAFADREFYERARSAAEKSKARLYIPHGAVGGFDVLQTVSLMAEAEGKEICAGIETRKGPASLRGTAVYREEMEEREEAVAFSGSCGEAIRLLPTKVNVAVAQSLITVGPEKASAKISSVKGFLGDEHTITAELPGIRVKTEVYSEVSDIAGWSVVSLLRSLKSPVCFF